MSGILGIALTGLNSAAANFAQSASRIVNASSTGGGGSGAITDNLVALQADTISYQANIAVAKVAETLNQKLIDVLV